MTASSFVLFIRLPCMGFYFSQPMAGPGDRFPDVLIPAAFEKMAGHGVYAAIAVPMEQREKAAAAEGELLFPGQPQLLCIQNTSGGQ